MRCLVTGVAGFIGSHLAERLIHCGYSVIGIDNMINGNEKNIEILERKSKEGGGPFLFKNLDIKDVEGVSELVRAKNFYTIFHNAALGSVPRSLKDPALYYQNNVIGTRNIFDAAVLHKVPRVVYASSSSVYGDVAEECKVEYSIGNQMNPYSLSKRLNELEASSLAWCTSETHFVGLRYFNVFGPRQRVGSYAAVIPEWLDCIKSGREIVVNGSTAISRDFTYIDNVTYMNMLCGTLYRPIGMNQIINVGCGAKVSLGDVLSEMTYHAVKLGYKMPPSELRNFRAGDVASSYANIEKAKKLVGYEPTHTWRKGIQLTCESVLSATE